MYISITETVRYFNTRTMSELFVITKSSGDAIKHQSGMCVVFSVLNYCASCISVVQKGVCMVFLWGNKLTFEILTALCTNLQPHKTRRSKLHERDDTVVV